MTHINRNLKLRELFEGMEGDRQIIHDEAMNQTIVLDKISQRMLVFRNCTGMRVRIL